MENALGVEQAEFVVCKIGFYSAVNGIVAATAGECGLYVRGFNSGTRTQLATAQAIQNALLSHPTAGKFLTHPNRAVEVSYFGIDDETGLEIRVRPDLEIDMGGVRIGFDLKTISMWNVKQSGIRARLHREIIERD
ncbi:hypothetical protein ABMA09_14095 [Erwinia rhapontici]